MWTYGLSTAQRVSVRIKVRITVTVGIRVKVDGPHVSRSALYIDVVLEVC